jgi:hypothetical protein
LPIQQKEFSADLCSGLLLRAGRGGEQCSTAGDLTVERVKVEQDCRYDFGHDIGVHHKGGHGVSFQERDCSCVTSPSTAVEGAARLYPAMTTKPSSAMPATLLVFEMLADPGLGDVGQGRDEGDIVV